MYYLTTMGIDSFEYQIMCDRVNELRVAAFSNGLADAQDNAVKSNPIFALFSEPFPDQL